MASSFRTIPQTVWEAHKERIMHLRFTESLPLSNKNNTNDGRTVMQVMRDDHQFQATQSQYEQQLKRWGAAKHMKQSDWKSILPIYNGLKQQGLSPRIRLGETVLDERRVIKAQRRYFGQSEKMPIVSITPRMSFAQNNLLRLDIRQHSGEYVEYSEFDATSNAEEIPSLEAPVQLAATCPSFQHQEIQDGQTWESGSRLNFVPEYDIQNNPVPLDGRMCSGEHLEHPEFDEEFNAEGTSSLISPVQLTNITSTAQCQALQEDPTLASGSPFMFATLSPGLDVFRPNILPLEFEYDDECTSSTSVTQHPWSANDPGSLLESFAMIPQARRVTHVNDRTRSPGSTTPRMLLFKPYIDSILDRIITDSRQTENGLVNSTAQMLAIKLEHLLVEDSTNASGYISDLMSPRSYAVSQLPQLITSCFVNNLAGLEEFPLRLLFGLIKADVNVRESLLAGLRSNNASFVTALANCALRSAICVGDEDIVPIILETTEGSTSRIDLNSTVYHLIGSWYSPLGLAAKVCHLGVVRKLLNFGAKVDVDTLNAVVKSWHIPFQSAHEYRSKKDDAEHQIIGILLANGASADCKTLETILQGKHATGSTLELVIRTVFKESHWELLKTGMPDDSYFATMMKENAWAETLFLELLEICQSMGCSETCKSTYSDAFDRILMSVISDGNLALTSSLLNHFQPRVGSLTVAIRTRNLDILQVLLSKKIDLNGCARCIKSLTLVRQDCRCGMCRRRSRNPAHECGCAPLMEDKRLERCCRPATPLSEAILWQNQDLIRTLEECGALYAVWDGRPGHLTAALLAAVRVGSVLCLKNLLHIGGNFSSRHDFEVVIEETIKTGHFEMTKFLFMTCMREKKFQRPTYLMMRQAEDLELGRLLLALKRRDCEMVFFFLEYGENFGFGKSSLMNDIVLEAVKWGDNAVIEYMHDFGIFRRSTLRPFDRELVPEIRRRKKLPQLSALGEAMAAGNTELVNQLLSWGAEPSEHIPFAVAIGDENMVRIFLDQGGKPSGVEEAITNGQYKILELLLHRGAAPVGLEQTIESGEHDMMSLLLRYGADPADDDAFSAALLCDDATFLSTLSSAFSSRYPGGKRGFGFRALETALVCRDTSIIQKLLLLNLDVNNYSPESPFVRLFPSSNILYIAIEQPTNGHAHFKSGHKCNPDGCKYSSVRRTDSEWKDILKLLLDAGADTENAGLGSTALLHAINIGRIETVKLLLDRDTNVNRPARRGLKRTPLQQACEKGDFEIIKLLLDKGAKVNALPAMNGGATALQLAAIKGSQRIVRLLLDEGADIHGPKAAFNGRTTLEAAAEHGRLSILNTILTEGASSFGGDEIKSAKALAKKEGHKGCVERLDLAFYRLRNENGTVSPLRL